MADRTPRPGDVAVMPLSDGAFGACQVTGLNRGIVAAYALHWHSATPPSVIDLSGSGPLRLVHHAHNGRLAHVCVNDRPLPPDFVWAGAMPVPDGVPAMPHVFSTWQTLADDVVYQRQWDLELPAAAKDAYRAAATRGQVEIDFGAGPVSLGAATGQLDLTPAGRPPVPVTGPVRWAALDLLPRCTTVFWSGPDRGLAAALAERPIISSLIWQDAPPRIDLTRTGLTRLTLTGQTVREVRLPRRLRHLELVESSRHLAVEAADDGRWLRLVVTAVDAVVPAGLDMVREVVLNGETTLSGAGLARLADLGELHLAWRKPPGELIDAAGLAGLGRLAILELDDGYGLAADTLPDLPSLTYLGVNGVRRSIVPALKARYRGTATRLVVRGAKADTWLAANLDNPLRDWVDDHARGGAAACKAYADAVKAIDKLPPGGVDRVAEAERILRAFIEALNRIEERYEIIDTLRREEAVDAFLGLAERAQVSPELADRWIDEWRDF